MSRTKYRNNVGMDAPGGKIIAIGATSALVEVARTAACPRCAAGNGCGAGLLSGIKRPVVVEVPWSAGSGWREGDEVVLVLEPSHLLRATLLVYGLPLVGMVFALMCGWLASSPLTDGTAILLAVAGLAAGLVAGRRQLNRHECLKQFVPAIEGRARALPEFR